MPGPISDTYKGPPDGREPDWLAEDEADFNCQKTPDGTCQLAGTEECDECPYSG